MTNAAFLADLHDMALSNETIRERWAAGKYGRLRHDYAKAWWKLAGRKVRDD